MFLLINLWTLLYSHIINNLQHCLFVCGDCNALLQAIQYFLSILWTLKFFCWLICRHCCIFSGYTALFFFFIFGHSYVFAYWFVDTVTFCVRLYSIANSFLDALMFMLNKLWTLLCLCFRNNLQHCLLICGCCYF